MNAFRRCTLALALLSSPAFALDCGPTDGCSGGPFSSPESRHPNQVKHSDFFKGYAAQSIGAPGSKQPANGVYPARPPWNVAGVDYAVGVPDNITLKIPGVDPLPPHCYASITAPGVKINNINCQQDGGAGITFDGWDFTVNGGIYLNITWAVTGPVVIKNSKFAYGPNFAPGGAFANKIQIIQLVSAGSLLFQNNFVDANGPQQALDGAWQSFSINAGKFPMEFYYNAFLRARARHITATGYGKPQGDVKIKFNYFEGLTYKTNEAHGEIALFTWTGTMNSQEFAYNTWLEPKSTFMDGPTNGITSPWCPNNSTVDSDLTTLNFNNNVLVGNYAFVNGAYVNKVTSGTGGLSFQSGTYGDIKITDNWIDPTAAYYCWYTPGAPVTHSFTSGGNRNLLTGKSANGLAVRGSSFQGSASLDAGVLTVVSLNNGAVGIGSQVNINGKTVVVTAQGTGRGLAGTYIVNNSSFKAPLGGFALWADECNNGGQP
ncbi:hypothetical protein [uncultured Rhodoblastus sp.]|uniref:hypothetical protein n=1 Tax=uncultured Rhodoblastus sp. TaxID=543037 RepID=UPI0025D771D6|nr:hypothetical protein [uncultured Rhodoblastus sp.]